MHGIIPYMFDYWADPVVHLLLLKSSMAEPIERIILAKLTYLSEPFSTKSRHAWKAKLFQILWIIKSILLCLNLSLARAHFRYRHDCLKRQTF